MGTPTWMFVLFVVLTIAAFRLLHVLTRPAATARFGAVVLSFIGTATFMLWYEGPGAWRGALFGVWAGAAVSSLALADFSRLAGAKRWILSAAGAALLACGGLLLESGSRPLNLILVGVLIAGATIVLLASAAITVRLVRTVLSTQRHRA